MRGKPYHPVAGFATDLDASKADKLPIAEIAHLLAECRAGNKEALPRLQVALRYVPYSILERLRLRPGTEWEDVAGLLFLEFGDWIRRLSSNDIAAEAIEAALRADLRWTLTHYYAEVSPHIQAEASTNCEREKRGDNPYDDLHKEPTIVEDRDNQTLVNRLETPPGFDDEEDDLLGDLLSVCNTPIEREVVDLLDAHYTFTEVADLLGCTVYRVKQIVSRLKARL